MKKLIYLFLLAMSFSFTSCIKTAEEKDKKSTLIKDCEKKYAKWIKSNPVKQQAVDDYCYYSVLNVISSADENTNAKIARINAEDLAYRRLMCLETNCQNMPKK